MKILLIPSSFHQHHQEISERVVLKDIKSIIVAEKVVDLLNGDLGSRSRWLYVCEKDDYIPRRVAA